MWTRSRRAAGGEPRRAVRGAELDRADASARRVRERRRAGDLAPVAEPAISAPVEAASTSGPAPAPSDATDEPPPELMAEFKRLEPAMADCIQAEWGSGEWTTQTVDVDWTLDRDGRLTAHFVKASTWCSAAVVERRLDALRFAPRDRALHGTHRFVFRMRI